MANDVEPPEISPGALSLLRIARKNDVYRAMAKNAALLAALEFGKDLIETCEEEKLSSLFSFLQTETPPRSFLAIAAASLRCIRDRMEQHPSVVPAVNDFNRHVLQGFAETLADLAWPDRNAQDFDGPTPKVFLARIALSDLETLWTSMLKNYLGNIYQDYFAALRVREEVTDLDQTVESNLRLVDASALAEYAMRLATSMGGLADPAMVAFSLDQAIDETLRRSGAE